MSKVIEPVSLSDFRSWSRYLRECISGARKAEGSSKTLLLRQTVYGATRFYCYSYYVNLQDAGLVGNLEAYLAQEAPHPGPQVGGALAVLNLVECGSRKELLTPWTRSRTAKDIEFAWRHNVEPALVLGFLSEVGSSAAAKELWDQPKRIIVLRSYQRN